MSLRLFNFSKQVNFSTPTHLNKNQNKTCPVLLYFIFTQNTPKWTSIFTDKKNNSVAKGCAVQQAAKTGFQNSSVVATVNFFKQVNFSTPTHLKKKKNQNKTCSVLLYFIFTQNDNKTDKLYFQRQKEQQCCQRMCGRSLKM